MLQQSVVLTDAVGNFLDGDGNGTAGGNASIRFNPRGR